MMMLIYLYVKESYVGRNERLLIVSAAVQSSLIKLSINCNNSQYFNL